MAAQLFKVEPTRQARAAKRPCPLPTGRPASARSLRARIEGACAPPRQVLLYERPHAHKNDIPEVLDDDLKRLCDFGVVGGGTIIIEEQAS